MGSQNGKQQSTVIHHQSTSIKKKIKSKDTLNSSFGTVNYDDRLSAGNTTLGRTNDVQVIIFCQFNFKFVLSLQLESLKSSSNRNTFQVVANDFEAATPVLDKKWKSKEDLLLNNPKLSISSTQSSNDPSLYVALYDYLTSLEKHLNMHKGDQVHILSFNKTNEW